MAEEFKGHEYPKFMRILIIGDEPRLLANLARAFREESYAVDTAERGDDGLYKAQTFA